MILFDCIKEVISRTFNSKKEKDYVKKDEESVLDEEKLSTDELEEKLLTDGVKKFIMDSNSMTLKLKLDSFLEEVKKVV